MAGDVVTKTQDRDNAVAAELTEAELDMVVGGTSDQNSLAQLVSTVLKDLHDIRAAIIRNTAV